MPGKASGSIIGYKYYLGMHMVLCKGPIDALLGIRAGDRALWGEKPTTVGLTTTQDFQINQPDLFGGDKREGGIAGTIGLKMGEATQAIDPYLQQFFGIYTPAFRGVVSIIVKHAYIGVNPYLKNWSFLLRRTPSKTWLPQFSQITATDGFLDANPAHIIRECITHPDWGMGYPEATIDEVTFAKAAETLFNESFGISLIWDKQSPVDQFIQKVLSHVNGILAVSPITGLFELRLLRADYVVSEIPHFNETNIISLDSYQRAAWGETVNEVIVQFTDRYTGKPSAVTVQDLANMQIQKTIVTLTNQYHGINDSNLASRVAQRDLQTLSTPMSKVKFYINREAWNIQLGDVFVLSWGPLEIDTMVYRVGEINQGTLTEGSILISGVEDVFALPAVSYVAHTDVPSISVPDTPVPAVYQRMVEATFYDLVMVQGTTNAKAHPPTAAFVLGIAARPSQACSSFQFMTSAVSADGPYDGQSLGNYGPSCTLPILQKEIRSVVAYTNDTDFSLLAVGDYGYVEDEMVSVDAVDTVNKIITLNRGVFDTIPAYHPISQLYLMNKFRARTVWEYAADETISGYILPQAPLGTLDKTLTTPVTVGLLGRPYLPYPPGNLQVNNLRYPANISRSANIVLTWSHRDRTQQTAYIVLQSEGNIGPEVGVTYSVSIGSSLLGVLLSASGLTTTTITLPVATITAAINAWVAANGQPFPTNSIVSAGVWADRGGYASAYHFSNFILSA